MDSLGKKVHAPSRRDGRTDKGFPCSVISFTLHLKLSATFLPLEPDMDFFWFFLGIVAVAAGLTSIKKSSPNH